MARTLSGPCEEAMVSTTTVSGPGRIYLASGHCLRGAAVLELEVQKLRCHVADGSWFATRCRTWFHERRIGDDTRPLDVRYRCQ